MALTSPDERGRRPQQAGNVPVRFATKSRLRRPANALSRLEGLIPRRWRRWVVVQGCRFWKPG